VEGAHDVRHAVATLDQFFIDALGFGVPLPRVLEGLNLRGGARAVLFGEQDVVVLTAVEGRVEVDEIDGFVLDLAAKDFEVIAVVKFVLSHWGEF
jgi:hypothetical protein